MVSRTASHAWKESVHTGWNSNLLPERTPNSFSVDDRRCGSFDLQSNVLQRSARISRSLGHYVACFSTLEMAILYQLYYPSNALSW